MFFPPTPFDGQLAHNGVCCLLPVIAVGIVEGDLDHTRLQNDVGVVQNGLYGKIIGLWDCGRC